MWPLLFEWLFYLAYLLLFRDTISIEVNLPVEFSRPGEVEEVVKVPNVEQAIISPTKISNYLLSPDHPQGRFKAAFFRTMGFARSDSPRLAVALLDHAMTLEVTNAQDTKFGTRYIIDGPLNTPSGRTPLVRTVWIIETGQTVPRFVTAYPL